MISPLLDAVTIDAGVAIGASGLLIAGAQIWLGRHHERQQTTLELIRQLQETDFRRARFQARQIMDQAAVRENRFDDLDAEERSLLSSVASVFGVAGVLIRRGKLDRRLFLEMYGNSIIQNYKRLEPYRIWRRARYGSEDGGAWGQFDYAYQAAKRQLGRKRSRKSARTS